MWIKEIRLKNYRAFGEEVVVKIPKGRHLLVYGENGSGKSSLCNAVREVLKNPLAGDEDDLPYTANIWYDKKQEKETGEVSLLFDNGMKVTWKRSAEFKYDGRANDDEETNEDRVDRVRSAILRLGKFSGFLSYKDLIPIYGPTLLSPEAEGERMFSLFTEVLFAHYQMKDVASEGGIRTREFSETYKGIQQRLLDGEPYENIDLRGVLEESISDTTQGEINEGEELSEAEKEEPIYEGEDELNEILDREMADTSREDIFTNWDIKGELAALQLEVNDARAKIVVEANRYLTTYFKSKVVFNVSDINIRVELTENGEDIKFIDPFVAFGVGLYQTQIPDYRNTLNEARLSSFSLCFLLAAIKQLPVAPGDPRVLFLDDIFTGLDLSNRMPLLELIKAEFMDDSADKAPFQVAIATHDRGWYELAKFWFEQQEVNLTPVEIYVEKGTKKDEPDRPVIITNDLGYLEKAQAYFKAKDYPSTANLLRKESEKQIRRILPKNKRMTLDEKSGKIKQDTSLESLEKKLLRYLEKNEFDTSQLLSFSTYKKVVLNPLSHDDLLAPHYRDELIATFEIVKYLRSIIVKDVEFSKEKLVGEASLDFGYTDKTNDEVIKHQIFPREQLRCLKLPNQNARFSVCECIYEIDKHRSLCNNLLDAIDLLLANYNQPKEIEYEEVYKHLKVKGNERLSAYLPPKTTPPQTHPPASGSPGS